MENTYSMYYRAHPMVKEASPIPIPMLPRGSGTIKSSFANQLEKLINFARNNPAIVSGAGLGLVGGTWLGNKAYNAQIPPVRTLPRLEQRPMVPPYYQN